MESNNIEYILNSLLLSQHGGHICATVLSFRTQPVHHCVLYHLYANGGHITFSENFRKLCATTTQHKNLNEKSQKLYKYSVKYPYMTVLVGLNIFVSSFNSGRQSRAIASTTRWLADCHSLVGSTPASCFRGHIISFF